MLNHRFTSSTEDWLGSFTHNQLGEIRQAGRSTQGVRLVRMDEGDLVAAASVIPAEEEAGDGSNGSGNGQNNLPLQ